VNDVTFHHCALCPAVIADGYEVRLSMREGVGPIRERQAGLKPEVARRLAEGSKATEPAAFGPSYDFANDGADQYGVEPFVPVELILCRSCADRKRIQVQRPV
jgi:hypothetical protein